ncbi:MAG: ABC transporter permease [Deinococcota bacterium]|jgi:peptide/nickel transport system permease protein|nr:ABC transporter permease [Deinococcota bacterium]
MLLFVLKRSLAALASVFLAALLVFVALLAVPGDPAEVILGINASPQALQALREQLGLTLPPVERFARWLGGLLRGDLGVSINYGQPVTSLIVSRLEVSLPLAFGAMLLACLVALPLGVLAALRQGSWLDPLVTGATQLGAAVPSFWLGLLLILLFSVELGWLPAGGWTSWSRDPLRAAQSLVLPVLALGLGQAAVITRQTRAAMLEVLGQDYIRTARAKGLRARRVVYGHALKNTMVTLLTIIGLSFSQLLVGAIIVEQVFSLPGLGRLALTAIGTRDFPLLQGEVLFYATVIVLLNFLVDLSYSLLDPRIRYS